MIISFDLASGRAEIEDHADESRLQLSIYGEVLFYLDAIHGALVLGYEAVEGEEHMVVTFAEIGPRRWVVAARLP